jgi:hypothetical protein
MNPLPTTVVLVADPSVLPATGTELLISFCIRLALGLTAALILLPSVEVAPRFYRTQFLVVLGLAATAGFFLARLFGESGWSVEALLLEGAVVVTLLAAFVGSALYTVEGAPGGRICIALTVLALSLALIWIDWRTGWLDGATSAALLGAAMSSMLMGHSYLIAPGMSMTPLRRLLVALFIAAGLRFGLEAWAGVAWWQHLNHGKVGSTTASLQFDGILMLVRLSVGIVGVAFLGWLAWRCAAIRSTQSATGILYVVVILSFFGELLSLLLHTGYFLKTQV